MKSEYETKLAEARVVLDSQDLQKEDIIAWSRKPFPAVEGADHFYLPGHGVYIAVMHGKGNVPPLQHPVKNQ